jgi:ABC-type transport system involved in cytochrome c biogenesis ATPase subunit
MARTLVADAELWLLDEPTANLDLRHQIALLDCVAAHCDDGGEVAARKVWVVE